MHDYRIGIVSQPILGVSGKPDINVHHCRFGSC